MLYSFSIQRCYFESDAATEPKWTSYLRAIDLPVAALAIQQAWLWASGHRFSSQPG